MKSGAALIRLAPLSPLSAAKAGLIATMMPAPSSSSAGPGAAMSMAGMAGKGSVSLTSG